MLTRPAEVEFASPDLESVHSAAAVINKTDARERAVAVLEHRIGERIVAELTTDKERGQREGFVVERGAIVMLAPIEQLHWQVRLNRVHGMAVLLGRGSERRCGPTRVLQLARKADGVTLLGE